MTSPWPFSVFPRPIECPDPGKCVQGPDSHQWTSDCERRDEGWSNDVPSSSAYTPLETDGTWLGS